MRYTNFIAFPLLRNLYINESLVFRQFYGHGYKNDLHYP